MRTLTALVAAMVTTLVLGFANGAQAADVVERASCDIGLSGVLEPGDSAAIRRLVEAGGCSYTTLHLDSPGGSIAEALEIARNFSRTTTVIDEGAQCLSACSLVFMAGRTCAGSPYYCAPTRRMHRDAVLGFHAPFLQSAGAARLVPLEVSFSEAVVVFAEILDAFAQFSASVRQTGYDKDIIPSDLLTKMFMTPPENFYYVETNDQVYSWDIWVDDSTVPLGAPALDAPHVRNLCYSLVFSEMRGWSYTPYGFDDYRLGLDELDMVAGPLQDRPLDTSFVPADTVAGEPRTYLMSFEYLNMGPAVSGWCKVTPDLWQDNGGYFSVEFRGDYGPLNPEIDANGMVADVGATPLSFDAQMHYSMAFPPGTPLRDLALR